MCTTSGKAFFCNVEQLCTRIVASDYPPVLGSHPPQHFRSFLALVGQDFIADLINANL